MSAFVREIGRERERERERGKEQVEERKREVGRKSERNIVCERAKECICKRDIVREGKSTCERHKRDREKSECEKRR